MPKRRKSPDLLIKAIREATKSPYDRVNSETGAIVLFFVHVGVFSLRPAGHVWQVAMRRPDRAGALKRRLVGAFHNTRSDAEKLYARLEVLLI